MADEPTAIISDAQDGEVNGLRVSAVRAIVAMLAQAASHMMKSGVVYPEEVASAFATVTASVLTVAYEDIEFSRKLLGAAIDLLPGCYEDQEKHAAARKEAEKKMVLVLSPHLTPQ